MVPPKDSNWSRRPLHRADGIAVMGIDEGRLNNVQQPEAIQVILSRFDGIYGGTG
jgi:hypothetical protein